MSDPIEPAAPATVGEAVLQANALAYGFDKHKNDGYWDALYLKDRAYGWSRMLGWQAGGDDVARFGAYAHPPSPWHGTPIDPPVDPPVVEPPIVIGPPPPPSPAYAALSAQLDEIKGLIVTHMNRPAPTYEGAVDIRYLGRSPITLAPKS